MKLLFCTLILSISLHFSTQAQTIVPVKKVTDIDVEMIYYSNHVSYNGKLYFTSKNKLYVTDGTAQGTTLVKTLPIATFGIPKLAVVNNKMVFVANDGTQNWELWVSDGTEQGTNMLIDINPNGQGVSHQSTTNPNYLLPVVNGAAFFYGNDGTNGIELWKTDGTVQGTVMVKNINTIPGDSIVSSTDEKHMIAFNDMLFFQARDAAHGDEVWVSDGTDAGTKIFADILPGAVGSFAGNFVVTDNKLFFNAAEISGLYPVTSIYVSNGTIGNYTKLLHSAYILSNNDYASQNGKTFIRADIDASLKCILVTDGTPGNTDTMMTGIASNFGSPYYLEKDIHLTELNGKVYFHGSIPGMTTSALWQTDGTKNGTTIMQETVKNNPFTRLTKFGNNLYFNALDTATKTVDLWQSNGTITGTKKMIYPGAVPPANTSVLIIQALLGRNLMIHGTDMYFIGYYAPSAELCKIGMFPDNIAETNIDNNVSIYPNPAQTQAIITGTDIHEVTIKNIAGITVHQQTIDNNKATVDMRTWTPGIYIATITNHKNETTYSKLIKQ